MPFRYSSRQSGIEFAVGCFLFGLGAGQLIWLPGLGLYGGLYGALTYGGYRAIWIVWMLATSVALVLGSMQETALRLRLFVVVLSLVCWAAVAFEFMQVGLWGGALQAMICVALLNQCMFQLIRHP